MEQTSPQAMGNSNSEDCNLSYQPESLWHVVKLYLLHNRFFFLEKRIVIDKTNSIWNHIQSCFQNEELICCSFILKDRYFIEKFYSRLVDMIISPIICIPLICFLVIKQEFFDTTKNVNSQNGILLNIKDSWLQPKKDNSNSIKFNSYQLLYYLVIVPIASICILLKLSFSICAIPIILSLYNLAIYPLIKMYTFCFLPKA